MFKLSLAVLALVIAATTVRADSFVASPQDYPSATAWAAAYASVDKNALKTKNFNPSAYGCADQCKANMMTPIERRIMLDNQGSFDNSLVGGK